MPRLSLAFFTAAVIYGICGMLWGAYMASTDIFTLATAHAHLNLLGSAADVVPATGATSRTGGARRPLDDTYRRAGLRAVSRRIHSRLAPT